MHMLFTSMALCGRCSVSGRCTCLITVGLEEHIRVETLLGHKGVLERVLVMLVQAEAACRIDVLHEVVRVSHSGAL